MVLVEGKMQGWGRAENVLKVLDLLPSDQEVTIKDIIDAVSDCGNVTDSIKRLLQDCEICYCTSPISKVSRSVVVRFNVIFFQQNLI